MMMLIKMKNHPLDQTRGPRDAEKERSLNQQALQRRKLPGAGKSTKWSKSRQMSTSESATIEEPMQTTFEMEEPSHPEFDTGADNQPIVESSQHPECDGTLIDVRTALDDRLKGIRMKYLPQSTWRKSDKDRAAAMIQAIDKRLKTRRIMRSLERFVGGWLYEGDFRMLQRTI
nr:hypothetical protein [Tanacetum cinerariifolium]